MICEQIFRMLKKDAVVGWTEECQKAFDKIKEHLFKPHVLVPPEPGRPLFLYLSVLDGAFGCVLGQHDETGRKEQEIYYLSKKFTPYEARYSLLEHTCYALTWIPQKLRHYFCAYTTYLISRMDSLKYIFQKPMPTGSQRESIGRSSVRKFGRQKIRTIENVFPDEKVSFAGEDITKAYDSWRMFFDGAANFKGVGIRVVLVSETIQHYPISAKLRFPCTNNMAKHEACILGLRLAIDMNVHELLVIGDSNLLVHQVLGEWATKNTKILPYLYCVQELIKRFIEIKFKHVPRIQNEFADVLATLCHDTTPRQEVHRSYPNKHQAYCAHVEKESDGNPWFHDIKEYLAKGEYAEHTTHTQKHTL
ncbi:uncharacterized protein [Nicotiana sylvestris]|uniref:uncharacterized protein n=1 Tax=Nicotiana sylvestris TaxID=4096 RepID=UPI00388CA681